MFKRIIACFLAFATVSLLTVPAIADYDSGDDSIADYVVKSLWTLAQGSDSVGMRSFIDTFFSSDLGCAVSSDGLHHWQLVSDPTISLVTNAFTVRCAFCEENYRYFLDGEEGTFISSELSDIYDTWVSSQSGYGGSSGDSFGGSVSIGSGAGSYDRVIPPSLPIVSSTSSFNVTSSTSSSVSGYSISGSNYADLFGDIGDSKQIYSFTVPFDGYYHITASMNFKGYPSAGNFGHAWNVYNQTTGRSLSPSASSSSSFSHSAGSYADVDIVASQSFLLNSASVYSLSIRPYYLSGRYGHYGLPLLQDSPFIVSYSNLTLEYDHSGSGAVTSSSLSPSTRPAYYTSDATKLAKTSDNTASGSVTNVYTTNIFNESTKVFTEPTTGQQYLCDSWRYDYVNRYRGYKLDIADGSYTYNGTEVGYVYLMYFDDYLLILGYHDQNWINDIPSTATEAETAAMLQNAVFVDKYFYAVPTSSGSSSSGSSPYIFTETTTGQQYMVESIKTSFDGSARTICLDLVDDTYDYQGTSLTHILLDYSDSSVLISGYADDTILVSDTSTWPDREDALFSELHYFSVEVEGNTDQTSRVLGWFETFKTWLGEQFNAVIEAIGLGGGGSGDTIINEYNEHIDTTEIDNDYTFQYTDSDGETQQSSVKQIMHKFDWVSDVIDIGQTILTQVNEYEQASYAYEEPQRVSLQARTLGNDTAPASLISAPSIKVDLSAADSNYGYVYGNEEIEILDLSWYTPYKRTVDTLLSGFLWLLFLWGLFKAAPSVIAGVGITSNRIDNINDGSKPRRGNR